ITEVVFDLDISSEMTEVAWLKKTTRNVRSVSNRSSQGCVRAVDRNRGPPTIRARVADDSTHLDERSVSDLRRVGDSDDDRRSIRGVRDRLRRERRLNLDTGASRNLLALRDRVTR